MMTFYNEVPLKIIINGLITLKQQILDVVRVAVKIISKSLLAVRKKSI